jgi:hypothetical protein
MEDLNEASAEPKIQSEDLKKMSSELTAQGQEISTENPGLKPRIGELDDESE